MEPIKILFSYVVGQANDEQEAALEKATPQRYPRLPRRHGGGRDLVPRDP